MSLYRIVQTTDDRNTGLIVDLDISNLPTDFVYRGFDFDNINWVISDSELKAYNSNYHIILKPLT